MTDNSTFRDIAEESAVDADASSEAPKEIAQETTTPEEEKIETFAEDKDLTGLTPEQLRATKKEWEAAYTKKRQAETAQLKEYQAKIAELEAKVNIPSQPQGQGMQEKQWAASRQVELGKMSVDQYTEYMQDLMAEKARQIAKEEYQSLHAEEKENSLANQAKEQFSNTDSRLKETSPEYNESFRNEVQREIADLLDKHLAEHQSYEGFDVTTLTKHIIERKDKELDDIIKTRTQQSTQAAKMREAKAKKSEVRGSTSDSQQLGGNTFRSVLTDVIDNAA